MKNFKYYFVMMVLLVFGTLPAYAADKEGDQSHKHGTWQEKRFVAAVDADGIQRAEMVGGDYFYDPNYIIVKVNIPVELKIKKSAGYVPHNLIAKAPEAGIDFNIDLKGDPQTIKFTPTKIGKYPIYCDKSLLWFKTHREKGMEGLIEVVE
jgi:plastocyanin